MNCSKKGNFQELWNQEGVEWLSEFLLLFQRAHVGVRFPVGTNLFFKKYGQC